jgi:excisionase family DNA binding protein
LSNKAFTAWFGGRRLPRAAGQKEALVAEAEDDDIYLRSSEVAYLLHVSPKTVSRWAKEGKLPYRRTLGGHRRFPADGIRALAGALSRETGQNF